jgi:CRP-like cAMP-binding protein
MSDIGRESLRRVPLFRDFSDDECAAMLSVLRVRQFASGAVVFQQGKDGDTMVVVADGRLRVEVADAQGRKNDVGAIAQGEIVGEMAVLDPAPRTASVLAASDTVVYELSRANLELLRTTSPSASASTANSTRVVLPRSRRLRLRRNRPRRRSSRASGPT